MTFVGKLPCAALLLLLVSLGGCQLIDPIEVDHTFGDAVPLDGFGSSYGWLNPTPHETGDPMIDNPDLHKTLRSCARAKLKKKGYTLNQGTPDFLIGYEIGRRPGFEKAEVGVKPIEEGAIAMRAVTPSNSLLWHAVARAKILHDNPPKKKKDRLERSVNLLLGTFPDAD